MAPAIKVSILCASVVLTSAGVAVSQDSNKLQIENLREPRITTRKNEKMLVVEARGDPNVVGAKAFGLLFRLYYSIKETPKGGRASAASRSLASIDRHAEIRMDWSLRSYGS